MAFPDWPGGNKGVVIGINYNLGSRDRHEFFRDWRGLLPADELNHLARACGKTNLQAARIIQFYRHIRIPYSTAVTVWQKTNR